MELAQFRITIAIRKGNGDRLIRGSSANYPVKGNSVRGTLSATVTAVIFEEGTRAKSRPGTSKPSSSASPSLERHEASRGRWQARRYG